ncbi:MAG: zinc-ribbon domain-containing protein [Planctomycetota bacterium]|nr:MAG: zinc-ribbon domain-containing protein [Planctomycetota bacterium]
MFDEFDEDEWIEDEGDDEEDVLACPRCGREVHEDTQQCPYCGDWIIPIDPRDRPRRTIWIVAVVLVIAGLLLAVIL